MKEVFEESGIDLNCFVEKIDKNFRQIRTYVCNCHQTSLEQLFAIVKILEIDVKD